MKSELYERCRPRTWGEFVGNETAVNRIRALIDRPQFRGGCIWISGASGVGKSSLGALIAAQHCAPDSIRELDGDECTVDAVRQIETDMICYGSRDGRMKAVLVNEAHAMTPKAVQAWLTALENLPEK